MGVHWAKGIPWTGGVVLELVMGVHWAKGHSLDFRCCPGVCDGSALGKGAFLGL